MNVLHVLIQRARHASKAPVPTPRELPVLSAADLKLVAGGLPCVGGLGGVMPTAEPKPAA